MNEIDLTNLMQQWQSLNTQDKIKTLVGAILLGILLIYFIILKPVYDTNSKLTKQQKQQQQILTQLNITRDKLTNSNHYPTLTPARAKILILKTLSNNNISQRSLIKTRNKSFKKITVSIQKQAFNQLVKSLEKLKNQYGIVVKEANITKIDTGIVKANLTLIYP